MDIYKSKYLKYKKKYLNLKGGDDCKDKIFLLNEAIKTKKYGAQILQNTLRETDKKLRVSEEKSLLNQYELDKNKKELDKNKKELIKIKEANEKLTDQVKETNKILTDKVKNLEEVRASNCFAVHQGITGHCWMVSSMVTLINAIPLGLELLPEIKVFLYRLKNYIKIMRSNNRII